MVFGPDLHIARGWPPTLVYNVKDSAGRTVRVLRRGGVFQSATYLGDACLDPVFEYYRAFGRVLAAHLADHPAEKNVLLIGGGGCSFPKLVARDFPACAVDVCEIDPAVIDAARRWFFVDEARHRMADANGDLRFICADGLAYARQAADSGRRYGFLALDAFAGASPVEALATPTAAALYAQLLAPAGTLAANVVTPGGDASFLMRFQTALETAFDQVDLVCCADDEWSADDNFLLVAKAPRA